MYLDRQRYTVFWPYTICRPNTKTKRSRTRVHACTRADFFFGMYRLETRFARINVGEVTGLGPAWLLQPVHCSTTVHWMDPNSALLRRSRTPAPPPALSVTRYKTREDEPHHRTAAAASATATATAQNSAQKRRTAYRHYCCTHTPPQHQQHAETRILWSPFQNKNID